MPETPSSKNKVYPAPKSESATTTDSGIRFLDTQDSHGVCCISALNKRCPLYTPNVAKHVNNPY